MCVFLLKPEIYPNKGHFRDIPCLTSDSVLIGRFVDSVHDHRHHWAQNCPPYQMQVHESFISCASALDGCLRVHFRWEHVDSEDVCIADTPLRLTLRCISPSLPLPACTLGVRGFTLIHQCVFLSRCRSRTACGRVLTHTQKHTHTPANPALYGWESLLFQTS